MKPRVLVTVSNDLVTDHRVHKTCMTLHRLGWEVLLIGRILPHSPSMNPRPYPTKRMNLLFKKGPLFYAEMNLRYFLFLLFAKKTALLSNDLDTLPANFLAAKLSGCSLVFDSHEYYTEVPELVTRPLVQGVWKRIEKWIVPHLKFAYTVAGPIAELFQKNYQVNFEVVMNAPLLNLKRPTGKHDLSGFKEKIILVQGGGINIDRGMEELIEAMQYVKGGVLLIVGAGDVIPILKEKTKTLGLENKVIFYGRVPIEELGEIAPQAYVGLSIDKATNLNYELSLPNKLFDYIHAELPLICTPLPEVKRMVEKYEVGVVIEHLEPNYLAAQINLFLENEAAREQFSKNCLKAKEELCWEKEEQKIIRIFDQIYGRS